MKVDVAGRQDDAGSAYAGSQLQTQLYVNRRTQQLDEAIRNAFADLAGAILEWRSPRHPRAEDGYREYWDTSFLKRLDLESLIGELPKLWPVGGPHWDALGAVHLPGDDRPGVLLVEGKSYPAELFGSGTGAKPGSNSRKLIEKSLGQTQQILGVEDQTPEDWCGRLYQSANRLAHVYWLREQSVRAWLVHLLFTTTLTALRPGKSGRRRWPPLMRSLGWPGGPSPQPPTSSCPRAPATSCSADKRSSPTPQYRVVPDLRLYDPRSRDIVDLLGTNEDDLKYFVGWWWQTATPSGRGLTYKSRVPPSAPAWSPEQACACRFRFDTPRRRSGCSAS